jgi:hypothetical protein
VTARPRLRRARRARGSRCCRRCRWRSSWSCWTSPSITSRRPPSSVTCASPPPRCSGWSAPSPSPGSCCWAGGSPTPSSRARLYRTGLVVFITASVSGALAAWPGLLIASRGGAGTGAAVLYETELIESRGPWRSLADVELATAEYVGWYNRRLHSTIGGIPPNGERSRLLRSNPAATDLDPTTEAQNPGAVQRYSGTGVIVGAVVVTTGGSVGRGLHGSSAIRSAAVMMNSRQNARSRRWSAYNRSGCAARCRRS